MSKMKSIAIVSSIIIGTSAAFTAPTTNGRLSLLAATTQSINGWTPDETKFCAGLPGALAPVGEFDPLGLSKGLTLEETKRYREAEVTHGRVAMLAAIGYPIGESFHPLFRGTVTGPANSHLAQVQDIAPQFFLSLVLSIGLVEFSRALIGWETPYRAMKANQNNKIGSPFDVLLRDDYYPGDIGFDPLNLKPEDARDFANMQTKELQNGRLAMLAVAGFCAQEQMNGETIDATLRFLFK